MKNLPNILSALRILLVPVFVLVFLAGGRYANYWAALVFLAAAVSDFLDGYLARRLNSITNLGKVLDPVGDKLMTLAMVSCLAARDFIPVWIPWFFFAKELLMTAGGILYHSRISKEVPPSNIIGKTATFALFCAGLSFMLFKVPRTAAAAIIAVTVLLSAAAFTSYLVMFIGIWKKHRERPTPERKI